MYTTNALCIILSFSGPNSIEITIYTTFVLILDNNVSLTFYSTYSNLNFCVNNFYMSQGLSPPTIIIIWCKISEIHIQHFFHQQTFIKYHMVKFTCDKSLGDIQILDAGSQSTQSETTKDTDRAHYSHGLTTPLLHGPANESAWYTTYKLHNTCYDTIPGLDSRVYVCLLL